MCMSVRIQPHGFTSFRQVISAKCVKKFDSFLISFVWFNFSTDAFERGIDEVATNFVEIPNGQITIVNSRLPGFRTCPKYDTGCNNGMGRKSHQIHHKSLKD